MEGHVVGTVHAGCIDTFLHSGHTLPERIYVGSLSQQHVQPEIAYIRCPAVCVFLEAYGLPQVGVAAGHGTAGLLHHAQYLQRLVVGGQFAPHHIGVAIHLACQRCTHHTHMALGLTLRLVEGTSEKEAKTEHSPVVRIRVDTLDSGVRPVGKQDMVTTCLHAGEAFHLGHTADGVAQCTRHTASPAFTTARLVTHVAGTAQNGHPGTVLLGIDGAKLDVDDQKERHGEGHREGCAQDVDAAEKALLPQQHQKLLDIHNPSGIIRFDVRRRI